MTKKRRIWLICLFVISAITIVFVMKANNDKKIEEQQKELERAYSRQIYAFGLGGPNEYKPLPDAEYTEDGVSEILYFDFACYRKLTGESLTYDDVKEYLSQEYEDDGEIRIYTNGRHPEIAKYIEWFFKDGSDEDLRTYRFRVTGICHDYYKDKGIEIEYENYYPNRAAMDELIKKEADPDYILDERIMWEGLPYGPYADN